MANSTTSTASTKASWTKPYPGFPLCFHPPSGRLYKSIKGHRYYFGYARDWESAIQKYTNERDGLYAGLAPQVRRDGLAIRDLANHFLTTKKQKVERGELAQRTFLDYRRCCDRVVNCFGRDRLVENLTPSDFERLKADMSKTLGLVALGSEVARIRVLFNFAETMDLVAGRVRFGAEFKRPEKRLLRLQDARNGKRLFTPEDIRKLLDVASPQFKAMIMLGLNCALGPADLGRLEHRHIVGEFLDYPRMKTGLPRRSWLWPETRETIDEYERPKPKHDEDERLVFLSRWGTSWFHDNHCSPLSAEFRRLTTKAGLPPELTHYRLRHTCRTIADGCGDQPACNLLMGHGDGSMASVYRHGINDERLQTVSAHVHDWLYGNNAHK